MPRVATKKPRTKKGQGDAPMPEAPPAAESATAVAVEEPPPMTSAPVGSEELRPPTTPIETQEAESQERPVKTEKRGGGSDKDHIASSLNIAKLQAMSMTDLNKMARDLGVENFGTMRKHEVIFHILQKNAERAGVLFSEGVLEILPEGFGFLRSQSFNYLPCPEDIYVSPSQIRRFDLQTGNLIAGQIRPPKDKE